MTSVAANIFVDILAIDGVAVNNINANASMVFTNGGAYQRSFGSDGVGTSSGAWTGNLTLDLDAIIAAAGASGQATRVTLNINNTLTAFAGGNALAFIEKKDFDGLAVTVVPEPGTAILFGLGLAGLASVRRSRR
ncbi:MAG: PEP-CTERM sorting domain-containing protein [Myxococcota bacterium]